MSNPNCDHWIALSDRAAAGGELSQAELEWLDRHAEGCLACGTESAFWSTLGSVVDEPAILTQPFSHAAGAETRTKSGASRSRNHYAWALGLAAAAALAAAAVFLKRDTPSANHVVVDTQTARLISIAGRVQVGALLGRAGSTLLPDQTLRTEAGVACVAITDSITACLAESSEASLDLVDPTRRSVHLIRGRLVARLDKQPHGRAFSVETSKAIVLAKGTLFSVSVDATETATVRLYEGHVAVHGRASPESRELTAPASATIQPSIEVKTWSDEAAAEDQQLLALSNLPRTGNRLRLDVTTRPPGADVAVDGVVLGPTPVSALLALGRRLSVTLEGYASVTELLPTETAETVERSFELAPAQPKPVATETEERANPVSSAVSSPQSLLTRAQMLRSQGKYSECTAAYRQLIATFPRSDEARVSLVSLGELQLSELKQPAQALQSFNAYLRASGPLTREARYGKIRALQLLGRGPEQQAAIAEFLRDYPNSVQAVTLRQRMQTRQP
jgi:tetratricopeptide (TPR) repeat protein